MKKLIVLILLCVLTHEIEAQRERNYIYLFDCTKSMIGYQGSQNIWSQTKQYLHDDIENQSNDASIVIIPFQDKVLTAIQFEKKDFDWRKIDNQLDKYIETRSHYITNICAAWDEGLKYIDKNKDNYFYILTDGRDNHEKVSLLYKKIENWCDDSTNRFAFYIRLTPEASKPDPHLDEAIKECKNIISTDLNKHFNPIGRIKPNNCIFNMNDLPEEKSISLSTNGRFKAQITTNNPFFDIKLVNGIFQDGGGQIEISAKKDLPTILKTLGSATNYEFNCSLTSTNIQIVNPTIRIQINNIIEKTLKLDGKDEVNLGTASFYPKFLFWSSGKPKILEVDLKPIFNSSAIRAKASADFEVTEDDNLNDFDVFFNGVLCKNNRFSIPFDCRSAILGIQFLDNAKIGKRYFKLNVINSKNIDRINDKKPETYQLSLRAKYKEVWNPLKEALLWLFLLISIPMLLWFVFIRRFTRFGDFNKNIYINNDFIGQIRFNKQHKVILSNGSPKQSVVNKFLFGKNYCIINEVFTSPLIVKPYKNKPYEGQFLNNNDYVFPNVYRLISATGNQNRHIIITKIGTNNKITIN